MAHPKKWGQKVAKEIKRKGTEGTFTAAAKSGESTSAHVSRVLAPGSQASTKMKRKAQFIRNIAGYEHGGPVEETGLAMLHEGEYVIPEDGKHERYEMGRIPTQQTGSDGNSQVESAKEMEQSTVRNARLKQLGSNRYLGN